MSADNYLITIPAKGNKISLYLVNASDSNIDLDGPPHAYCKYISSNYANCFKGTYDGEEQLEKAVNASLSDPGLQIEYGVRYRHKKETVPLRVVPGEVEISMRHGYNVVGNDQVVCFFFDPNDRGHVVSSGIDESGVPNVVLSSDGSPATT
jgi:hypothetical protein